MTLPSVLILGATSDIAVAVAHGFASRGHPVQLAARDSGKLDKTQADLATRYGQPVTLHRFDVLDFEAHEAFVESFDVAPEIVISAVGLLGDQASDEGDAAHAMRVMQTNYQGPAMILGLFANVFEQRGSGCLVGISSVAGERGRSSNYIYGSAKAGFTAYLSGLRNRLAKKSVHVVTVLPGFVATKMTEGMDLPEKLTAQPEEVAKAIVQAVEKKKNVIYVRRIWWVIMTIIKAIPEMVFKKTSI